MVDSRMMKQVLYTLRASVVKCCVVKCAESNSAGHAAEIIAVGYHKKKDEHSAHRTKSKEAFFFPDSLAVESLTILLIFRQPPPPVHAHGPQDDSGY